VLTGEQYRVKQDPKDNVFTQRTWLYQNDIVQFFISGIIKRIIEFKNGGINESK